MSLARSVVSALHLLPSPVWVVNICARGRVYVRISEPGVKPHPYSAAGTTTIHIMPAPLPLRVKGNRSPADYRRRGGWVSCVVLSVLPFRGSSLLAVLCPERGAPVDCSPELPWEKEESYQRCLCRLKESAVDDCHRGSPLRSARSVHSDAVHAASAPRAESPGTDR